MSKVNSEIAKKDLLGVNAEMKALIESVEWDLVDASIDYAWEDQHKTDTVTGVTWLLVGPRRGDKRIRNKELTITSDEIVEQNVLDAYLDLDTGVSVKISDLDVASIWPKVNGTFATINIKLSGHVEVIPDEDDTKGKVK